jgi:hypothetical protein
MIPMIEIENATIARYFHALNAGDFETAGSLFALEGILSPPFHIEINGREAIAQYLQEEAPGLCLSPTYYDSHLLDSGETRHDVLGKIQTSLLSVKASWQIMLSPDNQISWMKIKLLASLVELLNARSKKEE